jgi:hypothetical protein
MGFKNIMSKKQYIEIIILAVIILGFLFYWYEYRPSRIKRECYQAFIEKYGNQQRSLGEWKVIEDNFFRECFTAKGL